MSNIIDRARILRAKIENMATDLSDAVALDYRELYPLWKAGIAYGVGDRVRYEDNLYKCLQAHTAQAAWTPVATGSLWAQILPGQDGTEIGPWEQPDSTNPYMTGDRVTFEGHIYESLIDNNLWSPADYPAGWQLIE